MKNFKIKVPNPALGRVIIDRLYDLGYVWSGLREEDKYSILKGGFDLYKGDLSFSNENGSTKFGYADISFHDSEQPWASVPWVTVEELFTQFNKEKTVSLGGTEITISKDGVVVDGVAYSLTVAKRIQEAFDDFPKFAIRAKTEEIYRIIEKKLLDLGYEWYGTTKDKIPYLGDSYILTVDKNCPSSDNKSNKLCQTGFKGAERHIKDHPVITMEDLFLMETKKTIKIGTYDAKVTGGIVRIGCKTFTRGEIDKVAKIIEEL